MPGKPDPHRRQTPICPRRPPTPAVPSPPPKSHTIIGNPPRPQKRRPPQPSISHSICAHRCAQPAPPCPICPFRTLAGRNRPHSPPKVPSPLRPLSSHVCERKTRNTIIGIGGQRASRAKYSFNNNLAFLWPRSAPDSPSKTGSYFPSAKRIRNRTNAKKKKKWEFVRFVQFVAFVMKNRSP